MENGWMGYNHNERWHGLRAKGGKRDRGSILERKAKVKKGERKRLSICFFSFVPTPLVASLAYKRYRRPKGRQSFQRNMIAALLQKAFHLEICDFLFEEKLKHSLSHLPFSPQHKTAAERPCVSEKGLSKHFCFQGPTFRASSFTDTKKAPRKNWNIFIGGETLVNEYAAH